jgi:hypothetical protein
LRGFGSCTGLAEDDRYRCGRNLAARTRAALFNHLVGYGKQRRRNDDAEHQVLGYLEQGFTIGEMGFTGQFDGDNP